MNSLRLRICFLMLLVSITPLSAMAYGLRYLPGGLLPWMLYGALIAASLVATIALSGFISRPVKNALNAMAECLRSASASEPKVWVPREYWALHDSVASVLNEERDQRAAAERALQDQGGAIAAAEAAALRTIAVLHSITEASDEAVIFAHANGHIALINPRAGELFPVDEALAQPGATIVDWLTAAASRFTDITVAHTLTTWHNLPGVHEGEWITSDNRTITAHTFDVREERGTSLGRVWRFVDVTEQRQLQQRLQESQKMESIGHLAGGIAHDFNNLLTAIRGNLSLAELEPNSAATRSKIDDANRAAGRATELVQQILGYSRKTSGLRRTTDIAQTINNVRTILRASLDPRVALRINLGPEPWAASADPMQIEQVLLNLCINARDALPSTGGEITITTANVSDHRATDSHLLPEHEGDFVVIRVRDNGSGIKPENRDLVFEPFFTTKAEGKGTGLGLAMAKNIIEQAGGRIAFESHVGRGTEFSIYLPRTQVAAAVEPKPVETPRPVATTRGTAEGTVLVVDDEAPVRAIAVNMLKYLGYRVLEACDGEQAIHVLQTSERPIDAVMMDVYMPKLSGRETYQRMRTLGIDLPVIVCSGFMVEPDEFIALANGRNACVQVIQKPYSMETLARVVAKAIAKGHHALAA